MVETFISQNTDCLLWIAVSFSIVGVVVVNWNIYSRARKIVKESSRFPMFEVRDKLIRLIVTKKMQEDDEAWLYCYTAVNSMLSMHQKLTLSDIAMRFFNYHQRLQSDPSLQRKIEIEKRKIKRAANKIPEFAQIQQDIDNALSHIIARRSNFTDLLRCFILVSFKIFELFITDGVTNAKKYWRTFVGAKRVSEDFTDEIRSFAVQTSI